MERENALPRIIIRNFETGEEHAIAFDEEAYSLGFGDMREYDTDTLRFTYSSPTTPAQVFDYDMNTRERVLMKTQEVPSGHTPSDYVARRVLAPAHDGEMIPVTLLYHKNHQTGWLGAAVALWLWLLWHVDACWFQHQYFVAGQSWLCLCNGAYSRRPGKRAALVQDWKA